MTSASMNKVEVIFTVSSSMLSSTQLSISLISHDSVDDIFIQTDREADPTVTTFTIDMNIVNFAVNKNASLFRRFNLQKFRVILTNAEIIKNQKNTIHFNIESVMIIILNQVAFEHEPARDLKGIQNVSEV